MLKLVMLICFGCLLQACNSKNSHQHQQGSHNDTGRPILQATPLDTSQLPDGTREVTRDDDSSNIKKYYPFVFYDGPPYTIGAHIERDDLMKKYYPVFIKHGYTGNGYSWEGHIRQILQKEDPELLQHLNFDPEAGAFYVDADNERNQQRFAALVSGVFKDIPVLESYLKAADRSQVDD